MDAGRMNDGPVVLDVSGISKTFVSQRALAGVDLRVGSGEVHALVGHNGSGKSTLIKILAGYHEPDPDGGRILVGGQELRHGDPDSARRLGLRFIHQELGLVDSLTVLENVRLGSAYDTGFIGRIRWRHERRRTREILSRVGLSAHPDALVATLSPVQRTQLAVARALDGEDAARVLFFDEPTATLPESEVERLFVVIRQLKAHGHGVVYISHRLEELPQIADRITVLRNGSVVGSGPQGEFSRDRLVDLIVGPVAAAQDAPSHTARADTGTRTESVPCLTFEHVRAGELVDASFEIGRGEIVGVAGLAGSGVHDIAGTLLGRKPLEGGTIRVEGEPVNECGPLALGRRSLAVLPSERLLKSIPSFTVRENLTLPHLTPMYRGGRWRMREERRVARELIDRFGVLPKDPERILAQLSGGNQQKVAVAKWLRTKPRVLVLDEPTQGVDVGGKAEILDLLRTAAQEGLGVVLCSSDMEDLELICDRVLVVREGRVASQLTGADINRERISEECYRERTMHV
jgi:ribose transport system ATP-binding protein